MPTNYKQSDVVGTFWKRANSVSIQNTLNGTPSITYHEFDAIQIADKIIENSVSSVSQTMIDENVTFPLVNSENWSEPMIQSYKDAMVAAIQSGEVPIWVIYQLLNSHYAHLATTRDLAPENNQ
jgi:hypothetical protein